MALGKPLLACCLWGQLRKPKCSSRYIIHGREARRNRGNKGKAMTQLTPSFVTASNPQQILRKKGSSSGCSGLFGRNKTPSIWCQVL